MERNIGRSCIRMITAYCLVYMGKWRMTKECRRVTRDDRLLEKYWGAPPGHHSEVCIWSFDLGCPLFAGAQSSCPRGVKPLLAFSLYGVALPPQACSALLASSRDLELNHAHKRLFNTNFHSFGVLLLLLPEIEGYDWRLPAFLPFLKEMIKKYPN